MQALRRAGLKEGERVFISGGAGGVGCFAIQIAKHVLRAAHVATSCSGAKAALCTGLGADEIFDYTKVKDKTHPFEELPPASFDVVFDCTGEAVELACLIKPGRMVVSVAHVPRHDTFDNNPNWPRPNMAVRGVLWMLSRTARNAAEARGATYEYHSLIPSGADLDELARHVEAGRLRVVVDTKFVGLDSFKEAFARIESGRAAGKVIIAV